MLYRKKVKQHSWFSVRLSQYLHHKNLASEASLQCTINQGPKIDKKHVIKNSATLLLVNIVSPFIVICTTPMACIS